MDALARQAQPLSARDDHRRTARVTQNCEGGRGTGQEMLDVVEQQESPSG